MALNFPNNPGIGSVYTDTTSGFAFQWDGTVWTSYTPASTSNIKIIDDISGSFNGITTSFAIASGGITLNPSNSQSLLVNLGGVPQKPGVDYYTSGNNLVFTDAPVTGLTFSGTSLGPAVTVKYANDGNIYVRNQYTGAGTTGPFNFSQGYTVGYLDVYRNGVRLRSGIDYVGTSGTNFFLTDAAQVNDELEAIGYQVTSLVYATANLDGVNVTGIGTFGRVRFADTNIKLGDSTTGFSITSGTNNFFAGVGAGNATTTGGANNFFGLCAGYSNTSGGNNNFFGPSAGFCNTSGQKIGRAHV